VCVKKGRKIEGKQSMASWQFQSLFFFKPGDGHKLWMVTSCVLFYDELVELK